MVDVVSVNYWNYLDDCTTTGSPTHYRIDTTASSGTDAMSGSTYISNELASGSACTYALEFKKILVVVPRHWPRPWIADFTRLVNDETDTGCKVTMVIEGDIDIVDPTVELREMGPFISLLRDRAIPSDVAKIKAFVASHPLESAS